MELFQGTFHYTSLQPDTGLIRLVTIQPDAFNGPIRCTLFHADLAASPVYEALSYA